MLPSAASRGSLPSASAVNVNHRGDLIIEQLFAPPLLFTIDRPADRLLLTCTAPNAAARQPPSHRQHGRDRFPGCVGFSTVYAMRLIGQRTRGVAFKRFD